MQKFLITWCQAGLKPQRNRKATRCGCQAYLRISKVSDEGMHEWRVTGFVNYHNHELLEPEQVRFLPAYRVISNSDKTRILMFYKSGITVQQMMRLMELEKCVEPALHWERREEPHEIFQKDRSRGGTRRPTEDVQEHKGAGP